MKKAIIFLILLATYSFSFSQTKIEKYCEIIIKPKNAYTVKEFASISFGKNETLFAIKDSSIILNLLKVNSLTTSTDVLNYMSSLGWKLVSINAFGPSIHERIYFKKEFDLSELNETR